MSTLIILIVSFLVLWVMNKNFFSEKYSLSALGRFALATMLLFTGTSHFYKTPEMVQMIPEMLPYKTEWVYFTGAIELLAAAGLVWTKSARWTSFMLIIFFMLIIPSNIIGSFKKVELGGMENGPGYLYFRIPLQILFIWWAYYFGIKLINVTPKKHLSYFHMRNVNC